MLNLSGVTEKLNQWSRIVDCLPRGNGPHGSKDYRRISILQQRNEQRCVTRISVQRQIFARQPADIRRSMVNCQACQTLRGITTILANDTQHLLPDDGINLS